MADGMEISTKKLVDKMGVELPVEDK